MYIIKRGDFEITRKMVKGLSRKTEEVIEIFGHKVQQQNLLTRKLGQDLYDIPSKLNVMIVGRGCMIGEEDAIAS